jgi:hypothetical protein
MSRPTGSTLPSSQFPMYSDFDDASDALDADGIDGANVRQWET